MKLPPSLRRMTRKALGMGSAVAIAPSALRELAARESVLTIAVGVLQPGSIDPALPGEQRSATLGTLAAVVANESRQRAIVLHCG